MSLPQVVLWSCSLGDMFPRSVGLSHETPSKFGTACTWCISYPLFVCSSLALGLWFMCLHRLLYSMCACALQLSRERCRSLPPPQQAVCPTTMCVLSMSGRPLSVGASCQCQTAATLSCEWFSACCHSPCISPCPLVLSACLPQVQCDDRQLLGHEPRQEGNLPSVEEDTR